MLSKTLSVLVWAATVLAAFLRFQPITTSGLILTLAITHAVRVLTIFVPIKVLLLAGSEQIPTYLQPYLQEEQRYLYILILGAGLVVLYALLFSLELVNGALSHTGGLRALRRANQMALDSREGVQAPLYFNKFCTVAANLAFASAGFLVLAVIQPALAATSLFGILASYGMTSLVVAIWDKRQPGAASQWISEKLSGYLAAILAINLLLGFFVLLALFLLGNSPGVLITFLSFLILRQCLQVLKPTVTSLVTLAGKRNIINPLVFRRHREKTSQQLVQDQDLIKRLGRESRDTLVAQLLEQSPKLSYGKITLEWIDPSTPGVFQFAATRVHSDNRSTSRYEMRVFTKRTLPLAEHEDFLFSHLDRQALHAPPLVASMSNNGLYCRFLESGNGKRPPKHVWQKRWPDILASTWSVAPPRSLVRAFHTSRETLLGRVTDSLLMRAAIAVDSDDEANCLEELRARLPQLKAHLEQLPTIIHNPLLRADKAWLKEDGGVYLADWTRWSLEPIGFGLPAATTDAVLQHIVEQVLAKRAPKRTLTIADIRLVQACQSLEQHAARDAYKAVFAQAKKISAADLS